MILPQAVRNIMPQIGNNFIINIKDTSVMFIIGFTEFFAAHRAAVGATYQYFPSAAIEMIGYLCMTLISSFLLRKLEKRLDGSDSYELAQADQLVMAAGTYSYPDRGTPFDEKSVEFKDGIGQESENSGNGPEDSENRREKRMSSEAILEVRHLSKAFGHNEVLKDIDFAVHPGDVTSIIGPSGSGKSTLLRCINLLETPTGGEILFHGENITGRGISASGYRAKVGMVFQSFNLFNNMTVLENLQSRPGKGTEEG